MIVVLVDMGNSTTRFAQLDLAGRKRRPDVEPADERREWALEVANRLQRLRGQETSREGSYLEVPTGAVDANRLDVIAAQWGDVGDGQALWIISSVERARRQQLEDWHRARQSSPPPRFVKWDDFPFQVQVDAPDRVGTDRLASAFAASALSPTHASAIVVDIGTAITIDAVDGTTEGEEAFLGGVILPGVELASRALALGTSQLPSLPRPIQPRTHLVIGRNTEQAIAHGVFWGCVGAIAWLVEQVRGELRSEPTVYVTGGGAKAIALNLPFAFEHQPDLVMLGMALLVS